VRLGRGECHLGFCSMTRKKHQQSRLTEREHNKMKLKQTITPLRSKMQSWPWYMVQTTYRGNQQHIERLLIEIPPFYRVSRQHRVNILKIVAMVKLTLSAVTMRCSREGQMAAKRFSLICHWLLVGSLWRQLLTHRSCSFDHFSEVTQGPSSGS
jgi:hypothetical protein